LAGHRFPPSPGNFGNGASFDPAAHVTIRHDLLRDLNRLNLSIFRNRVEIPRQPTQTFTQKPIAIQKNGSLWGTTFVWGKLADCNWNWTFSSRRRISRDTGGHDLAGHLFQVPGNGLQQRGFQTDTLSKRPVAGHPGASRHFSRANPGFTHAAGIFPCAGKPRFAPGAAYVPRGALVVPLRGRAAIFPFPISSLA